MLQKHPQPPANRRRRHLGRCRYHCRRLSPCWHWRTDRTDCGSSRGRSRSAVAPVGAPPQPRPAHQDPPRPDPPPLRPQQGPAYPLPIGPPRPDQAAGSSPVSSSSSSPRHPCQRGLVQMWRRRRRRLAWGAAAGGRRRQGARRGWGAGRDEGRTPVGVAAVPYRSCMLPFVALC